jgi:[ribosomal protein S18]-alanine N-acetyltransferase
VARKNNQVSGYLCFWHVADEIQLLNLAVRPDCRHQGVGRRLMHFLLSQAREKKAEQIILEVRPSNRMALGLYRSIGFETLYRRPAYYRPEGEDALVMALSTPLGEEAFSLK